MNAMEEPLEPTAGDPPLNLLSVTNVETYL